MKTKRKKKRLHVKKTTSRLVLKWPFIILAGVLVAITPFFIMWRIGGSNKKINKSNIYYDEQAFIRPKFLPTPATASALIEPIKIPIVMYHYIEYVQDRNDTMRIRLNTTPYQFEQQLKDFKNNGYETYFTRDIPDIVEKKIVYDPEKSIILTFDDGYKDFFTFAFPLLKKYHIRATIYIITNNIGRRGFMTKSDIEELISSGLIEVASHTKDHTYLRTASYGVAKRQIIESKKVLEEMFNIRVDSFAYPNGALSLESIALVKEAGYTNATSVIYGSVQSSENMFFLSRIRPGLFGIKPVDFINRLRK